MKPIKIVIALLAFATALSAQAAPLLNGLALEQQFNKDRYIAAVYSDTLGSSASVLLDNNTTRRLEVRVVADSLSARRFRNQWMEGIAINNPGDTLSGQADNMVTFANLFKGRFVKGDQLAIDFDGNSGVTTVTLNGVTLGNIRNRDFFNTLLRAWIGPVPPSSDFRDGLLVAGQVSAGLRATYELLEPSSARIAQLTSEVAEAGEEPAAEPEVAAAEPVAAKPQPTKPKLAADIPPPTLAAIGNKPNAAANAAASPAQPKPQPAKVATKPSAPQQMADDEDEDEGPLTADLILARQIYHSMLLRHTFKYIRYPKRAQERGQEGSVRMNVTIDSKGQVKDVQTLQESRYATLNREAREAVERAGPYPAAPPQLARDNYRFSVPITFRLPD
ncbi:TonB family C-terminal domain-containing protein [Microbulbifer donghaiensis]|uniref:TonB family C-terminal domain-containing protein n=1 Tax=Microbulbifer donghaiensis TaxID=494016 RepID=A0A1M5D5Q3_9GAMM|nr:TonB family protein [Microbulbifer donghaiensis]SHF62316.1 TonB family C-terminal domain-containing protein [Microbulbifer donghaiensis]